MVQIFVLEKGDRFFVFFRHVSRGSLLGVALWEAEEQLPKWRRNGPFSADSLIYRMTSIFSHSNSRGYARNTLPFKILRLCRLPQVLRLFVSLKCENESKRADLLNQIEFREQCEEQVQQNKNSRVITLIIIRQQTMTKKMLVKTILLYVTWGRVWVWNGRWRRAGAKKKKIFVWQNESRGGCCC